MDSPYFGVTPISAADIAAGKVRLRCIFCRATDAEHLFTELLNRIRRGPEGDAVIVQIRPSPAPFSGPAAMELVKEPLE